MDVIEVAKRMNHRINALEKARSRLSDLASLKALDCPILVGPSRKSFLGDVTGLPPVERLPGTLAASVLAYLSGARVFRVHDVAPIVQALSVTQAILASRDRTSRS